MVISQRRVKLESLSQDVLCMKMALMLFADNTGPDQPVHLHRLIRAFVACLQNQWIL